MATHPSKIFIGISLGGGKTDKACLAALEYFPKQNRLFLTKLYDRIKSDPEISADQKIIENLIGFEDKIENIALDCPWSLPLCLRCELECPGYEACKEPHVEWMWQRYRKISKGKKPKRLFTPYTQRCVESVLTDDMEIPFPLNHSMGANTAPLLARSAFLKKRLNFEVIEVFPEATLWRLGRKLKVNRSDLLSFKKASVGENSRRGILQAFIKSEWTFFYDTDIRLMTEYIPAFQAFLCAYTGFLHSMGKTEVRPRNFPTKEDWIEVPKN